jgi:hypothetical protein
LINQQTAGACEYDSAPKHFFKTHFAISGLKLITMDTKIERVILPGILFL